MSTLNRAYLVPPEFSYPFFHLKPLELDEGRGPTCVQDMGALGMRFSLPLSNDAPYSGALSPFGYFFETQSSHGHVLSRLPDLVSTWEPEPTPFVARRYTRDLPFSISSPATPWFLEVFKALA